MNLLLKNGTCFDGTGKKRYIADIRISGDLVVDIGNLKPKKNEKVLDIKDLYVAPGFIDINSMSDNYGSLFANKGQDSLVRQGITTILIGNDGFSFAPILYSPSVVLKGKVKRGINWIKFNDYLDNLDLHKYGVNVASMVGYTTVHRGVLRGESKKLNKDEVEELLYFLEESIKEGAFGVSSSLLHPETNTTDTMVLEKMMLIAKKYNALYSTTIRDLGDDFLDSFREMFVLQKKTDVNIHISKLIPENSTNWSKYKIIMEALADESTENISFDISPYKNKSSFLHMELPEWAMQNNFRYIDKDENTEKLIEDINKTKSKFAKMIITGGKLAYGYTGKSIGDIAGNQEKSIGELVVDLLKVSNNDVIVQSSVFSEDCIYQAIQSQRSIIATGDAGYNLKENVNNILLHCRAFGCMTKFLGDFVKDRELISWEEAIHKITDAPATKIGLDRRGVIKKKNYADLVVFDPMKIEDATNISDPYHYSRGISYVVVNGVITFEEGLDNITCAGRVLRKMDK